MSKKHKLDYQSPIGVIEIVGSEEGIYSILFPEREEVLYRMTRETPELLKDCYMQLDEYFKGTRYEFDIPYLLEGTVFQKNVWTALTIIPYAKTGSYKDIAVSVGNEKAVRAVGSTNGKNKLSIIIPCHRIIGANGKLTGYAGGLWRKEWLLHHERTNELKRLEDIHLSKHQFE
ncbi:methylated-DNA--[protein]-cysteine S-methyltransferase [Niallia sp. NCCP-28]|uniref:methylated-DNA--[protein]-cysteine S-methyltransferase n=1 Tax=Niallia sp. NCCP-28 TaxID=2934712 RepID=UPI0020856F8C|nr:methylated-DNA--[protein]-cysteine S-methyltransferase [Niallia sp. NCCP-28]GKU82621.1 methylated-DNA--protein-cysteine methyltransferase [Niallia sp. NCCP-28]